MVGKTIDHYLILEELGEGGMGVVYKARDTRLDRAVAIKILPHDKVADLERKRRFIQEAKAASALNHPHIITIYDIGQADGVDFIAMEYVDGRTLEDTIGRKGLKLSEALKYSVQVADALAATHEAGIVHRDLKPGNVMVTTKGQVKVLDFGLAKLTETLPVEEAGSTRTLRPVTEEGKVVGTVAYMSPEQVEGQKVDARSDIFSFGSLLYEMVTGKRAFQGESSASTMAAILKDDPKPACQIVEGLPREVERLISRCLRKAIEKRFQHMDDIKIALEELKEESDSGTLTAAAPESSRSRSLARTLAIPIAVLGLAAAIWLWRGRAGHIKTEKALTAVPLVTYSGEWDTGFHLYMPFQQASFSPDGNEIVFAWNWGNNRGYDIYRKMIGPGEPLRLTTDPANDLNPAWSPDGRFVAFMRMLGSGRYAVLLIPALGGVERRLTDTDYPNSLAWSPDGKWLVITDRDVPGQPGGLYLVSVDTGEKKRLTSPPANSESDMDASFSPDGRFLAYVRSLDLGVNDVYRISLSSNLKPSGEPERLTYENRYIQSPIWTRDGQAILYSDGSWWSSGRLVKRLLLSASKGPAGYPFVQELFGEDATHLAISPSGRRLVYTRTFTDTNIYRLGLSDNGTRVGKPETFINSTRNDLGPSYSPDGKTIAFTSTRSGTQEIWLCNSDGSSPRQLTSMGGPLIGGPQWSPDGDTLVFDSRKEGTSDLYLISSHGGAARQLTSDPGYEGAATWSRDGKWIYFESDRSGRDEVYKISASGGEFVQVTKQGGSFANESLDAKWLYYDKNVSGGIALWKTSVSRGDEVEINPGPLSFYGEFAVVSDGIYLLKKSGDLDLVDLMSGMTRTMMHLERPGLGLSVSPDRQWILITLLDQSYNDLMLVENFH